MSHNLCELPEEIICHCLSYLPVRSIVWIMQTNKWFYDNVCTFFVTSDCDLGNTSHPDLDNDFQSDKDVHIPEQALISYLSRAKVITRINFSKIKSVNAAVLKILASRVKRQEVSILKLNCTSCSSNEIGKILKNVLHGVKHLSLCCIKSEKPFQIHDDILIHCTNLQSLEIKAFKNLQLGEQYSPSKPPEVVRFIRDYSFSTKLTSLSLVSHNLQGLLKDIQQIEVFSNLIELKLKNPYCSDARLTKHIEKLTELRVLHLNEEVSILPNFSQLTKIEELNIDCKNISSFEGFAPLTNLKSLRLRIKGGIVQKWNQLFKHCQKLTHLDISDSQYDGSMLLPSIYYAEGVVTSLTTLDISGVHGVSGKNFIEIIDNCPNLITLKAVRTMGDLICQERNVATKSKLKYFNGSYSTSVNDIVVNYILMAAQNTLTTLILEGCKHIHTKTSQKVLSQIKHLNNLIKVNLNSCPSLNDCVISAITQSSAPALRFLDIGNTKIEENALISAISKSKSLQFFYADATTCGDNILEFFAKHKMPIKVLRLTSTKITKTGLLRFANSDCAKHLTKLYLNSIITSCSGSDYVNILKTFTNLQTLFLQLSPDQASNEILTTLYTHCKRLEVLVLCASTFQNKYSANAKKHAWTVHHVTDLILKSYYLQFVFLDTAYFTQKEINSIRNTCRQQGRIPPEMRFGISQNETSSCMII